jgi:transposase
LADASLEVRMSADRRKAEKQRRLRQQATLNPRPEAITHPLFRGSEFFDPDDLLQVKYEMLRLVSVEKRPVSDAAKIFGFSRPSFYQAQAAFALGGLAGLIPQKPGPRSGHKLTPTVMEFLTEARVAEPSLRPERLASLVKKNFGVQVHPRSIERQFLRQKKPQ